MVCVIVSCKNYFSNFTIELLSVTLNYLFLFYNECVLVQNVALSYLRLFEYFVLMDGGRYF